MNSEHQVKNALRESMRLNGDIRKKGDPLSSQAIINALVAVVFAIFGWLGNTMWTAQQSQQQQITQLNIELAKNYMPRIELQDQLNRMNAKLDMIDQQTKHK